MLPLVMNSRGGPNSRGTTSRWQRDGDLPAGVQTPPIPPVTRLPSELICEVFLRFHSANTNGLRTPNEVPLLLSQICRLWRRIALSTPRLWSSLTVSVFPNYCSPDITSLGAWIDQSGICPLSLALIYHDVLAVNVKQSVREPLNDVLALFRLHIRRWEHIYLSLLDIRPDHVFPPEFSFVPDNALLLATAHIFAPFSWHAQTAWLSSVFEDAPRFHSFTGGPTSIIPVLSIPFVQLTHIDLDTAISVFDCVKILSQTPILVDCKLRSIVFRNELHPGPLVHLRMLRSLYISTHLHLASLFDRLSLPALHHLTIHTLGKGCGHLRPVWPQSEFTSLLLRSACSISTFDVRNTMSTSSDYVETLKLLGSLVDLTIYEDGYTANLTDEVLALLTHTEATSLLCPKLERMQLHKCISATDGAVADMILSRHDAHSELSGDPASYLSRLRHVEIGLPPDHLKDIQKLQVLSQEGVVHMQIEDYRDQKIEYCLR